MLYLMLPIPMYLQLVMKSGLQVVAQTNFSKMMRQAQPTLLLMQHPMNFYARI